MTTVEIRLGRSGRVGLIDEADRGLVEAHAPWVLRWSGSSPYVGVSPCRGKLLLHRLLLAPAPGFVVDHINGDGLDNRRSNLRVATHQQNLFNQHRQRPGRFKGVRPSRKPGRWHAYIVIDAKQVFLGAHDSEREAALAYNAAALDLFGKFACLNEVAA